MDPACVPHERGKSNESISVFFSPTTLFPDPQTLFINEEDSIDIRGKVRNTQTHIDHLIVKDMESVNGAMTRCSLSRFIFLLSPHMHTSLED